jgi:nucleotide-binding universal stress UspA family protein
MGEVGVTVAPTTIVVGVDGSALSEAALLAGATLADQLSAGLLLFSAVASADDVEEREQYLRSLHRSGRASVEIVVDADPAGAILQALQRGDAIACMGSHGRGRSAAVLGSVTTEILARGDTAALLVGAAFADRPTTKRHRVVACIDETPGSWSVLPAATNWSRWLAEHLVVITVAEPVPEPVRGLPRRVFGPDGDVDAYLADAVRPIREAGADVETVAVYDPVSTADGMVSFVEEAPASLLALASHVRTGLHRLVFGSAAATVVARSMSPVLVMPRSDTEVPG